MDKKNTYKRKILVLTIVYLLLAILITYLAHVRISNKTIVWAIALSFVFVSWYILAKLLTKIK